MALLRVRAVHILRIQEFRLRRGRLRGSVFDTRRSVRVVVRREAKQKNLSVRHIFYIDRRGVVRDFFYAGAGVGRFHRFDPDKRFYEPLDGFYIRVDDLFLRGSVFR